MKQFEGMVKRGEKQGVELPAELREKLEASKGLIEQLKAGKSVEDAEGVDLETLAQNVQELEGARMQFEMQQRGLTEMRRGLKQMEQGLKFFEGQVKRLERQKITVPAEVTEKLEKIKTIVAAVKNAKSFDDVAELGMEELPELFSSLHESQQVMEFAARWPQTMKQVDRELSRVKKELARTKSLVAKLAKKGIDMSGVLATFEESVAKLQAVRDEAAAKAAAGEIQEAFDLLQEDFFGQMEDVWESQRIIQQIANLGRFEADFKRGMADAKRMIARLKRQKLDTSVLEELMAQAQAKAAEVIALIKSGEVDEESMSPLMQELEDSKQTFESAVDELTGENQILPWEQGPSQFKAPTLPKGFEQFIPQKGGGGEAEG